jgi:hypothetical protein
MPSSSTKSSRRSFRVVHVLALLIGAGALWAGWEALTVVRRGVLLRWVENHDGIVDRWERPQPIAIGPFLYHSYQRVLGPEEEPEIPRWREWLGDVPVNRVVLPVGTSEFELARFRALFPEAEVEVLEPLPPGTGLF